MSETFSGNLVQGQTGEYKRNKQHCDAAEVVYVRETADGVKFALIKKDNCKWDTDSKGNPVKESYSICWEISGKKYLLGLPVDPQDINSLIRYLNNLLTDKISKNSEGK